MTQVQVELEIKVDGVKLDATRSSIRIHGKNLTKNEYVNVQVYHTLEVGNSTPFEGVQLSLG